MRAWAFNNLDQTAERILPKDRIIAVALLTESDLTMLGPTFTRAWPVEDAPIFGELLREIDKAEGEINRRANQLEKTRPDPQT